MKTRLGITLITALCGLMLIGWVLNETTTDLTASPPDDPILKGLSELAVASISDAVDEVTGQRGFMSPDLRPIIKGKKIVGRAATVRLRKVIKVPEGSGLNHSVQILDNSGPGTILVVKIEDGVHIAGIGGLMATTCVARGIEGAVIDGGARDIIEMQELGFQVYMRGVTPATSVGRYTSVSSNEPMRVADVWVNAGDIIVGDYDGVVCVPAGVAAKVLEIARAYEEKEKKMVPLIRKYKSLQKALDAYGRI